MIYLTTLSNRNPAQKWSCPMNQAWPGTRPTPRVDVVRGFSLVPYDTEGSHYGEGGGEVHPHLDQLQESVGFIVNCRPMKGTWERIEWISALGFLNRAREEKTCE